MEVKIGMAIEKVIQIIIILFETFIWFLKILNISNSRKGWMLVMVLNRTFSQ
jgi:hypothetical protein